jgi:hypothetical protein
MGLALFFVISQSGDSNSNSYLSRILEVKIGVHLSDMNMLNSSAAESNLLEPNLLCS